MDSVFNRLNAINVNDHTEQKNGLTYLSWAWAWAEVKKLFPAAFYTIYERDTEFGPVNYFTDGRTCWVKTGVNIDGLEHVEELPVMDMRNRSISYDAVTSMDVNKAIQRSLTKACARHGLGLYIYAGEDLPEEEADQKRDAAPDNPVARAKANNPLNIPPEQTRAKPADKPLTSRQMASDEQKAILRNMVNLEQLAACNHMYGDNWERMTANQCSTMINKIRRERAAS